MAHAEFPSPPAPFNATYLNQDEQHLLMTALNSNQPGKGSPAGMSTTDTRETSDFYSPDFGPVPGSGQFEETPYLEYDGLDEGTFDWEVDGQMIGDLPGAADGADDEIGDKRKNPADEEGSNKRSSEDKTNKKPGRKPLTSEPTTVSRSGAHAK
jgi:AP-1-like factor